MSCDWVYSHLFLFREYMKWYLFNKLGIADAQYTYTWLYLRTILHPCDFNSAVLLIRLTFRSGMVGLDSVLQLHVRPSNAETWSSPNAMIETERKLHALRLVFSSFFVGLLFVFFRLFFVRTSETASAAKKIFANAGRSFGCCHSCFRLAGI